MKCSDSLGALAIRNARTNRKTRASYNLRFREFGRWPRTPIFTLLRRLFLFLCCFAYKYSTKISSVSDSTCAMIPNDQILSLTARKRQPPRKPSTVFRVRVHALFEWQNCPKVAFAFVLVLDAFALCINGP